MKTTTLRQEIREVDLFPHEKLRCEYRHAIVRYILFLKHLFSQGKGRKSSGGDGELLAFLAWTRIFKAAERQKTQDLESPLAWALLCFAWR